MDIKSRIIFDDKDLVIVNKPSGMLSIPDGYNPDLPCVKNALANLFGRIWTVHRLDKKTSGILVFAKNKSAHRELNIQFSRHQIHKEYRARVHGVPVWDRKTIDIPLKVNGDRRHRTVPDSQNGKAAKSTFYVIERLEKTCMMKVVPETGLTHQIRSHSSCLGFPIFGDDLYWRQGNFQESYSYQYPFPQDKLYLHAISISFKHPSLGKNMTFKTPLPDYFNI